MCELINGELAVGDGDSPARRPRSSCPSWVVSLLPCVVSGRNGSGRQQPAGSSFASTLLLVGGTVFRYRILVGISPLWSLLLEGTSTTSSRRPVGWRMDYLGVDCSVGIEGHWEPAESTTLAGNEELKLIGRMVLLDVWSHFGLEVYWSEKRGGYLGEKRTGSLMGVDRSSASAPSWRNGFQFSIHLPPPDFLNLVVPAVRYWSHPPVTHCADERRSFKQGLVSDSLRRLSETNRDESRSVTLGLMARVGR